MIAPAPTITGLDRTVHEIRAPLASILAALELLDDGIRGPVTPDQRALVALGIRHANDLRVLIDRVIVDVDALDGPRVNF